MIDALAEDRTDLRSPAQNDKQIEQRQELEKKTLALLNDIASAAWSLKLPENRLFVMSSAADLFWAFDEKRARNLYWEVLTRALAERLERNELRVLARLLIVKGIVTAQASHDAKRELMER